MAIVPRQDWSSVDSNGDLPPEPCPSVPTGCRVLLLAILEDVFLVRETLARIAPEADRHRYRSLCTQAAKDREWLAADNDAPFSFLWLCQHLALDPDSLRHSYDSAPSVHSNLLAGWKQAAKGHRTVSGDPLREGCENA